VNATVVGKPRPVIIDTDMGADDWMAILILLRSPKADVKAVTVTGAGLAHIDAGTKNALDLLSLASHETVPVAKGGPIPLRGSHTFPLNWRETTDNMLGLTLPTNQNPPAPTTAIDTIISVIEGSPEKVTILAIGPLANVAAALLKKPSIKAKLHMIYVMGGAVHVTGNVGAIHPQNSSAEWNIYIDPHAASVVFASGAPVTLIPLDATNQVPVTLDFCCRLKKEGVTPEADFVSEVLTQKIDLIKDGRYFFWDPLAAAILMDESLATFQEVAIRVIESEGDESGRTVADNENGNQIRVCVSAESTQFQNLILDVINGHYQGEDSH
jgi:inosine-uridine nucleoside N-ribohydrolase